MAETDPNPNFNPKPTTSAPITQLTLLNLTVTVFLSLTLGHSALILRNFMPSHHIRNVLWYDCPDFGLFRLNSGYLPTGTGLFGSPGCLLRIRAGYYYRGLLHCIYSVGSSDPTQRSWTMILTCTCTCTCTTVPSRCYTKLLHLSSDAFHWVATIPLHHTTTHAPKSSSYWSCGHYHKEEEDPEKQWHWSFYLLPWL